MAGLRWRGYSSRYAVGRSRAEPAGRSRRRVRFEASPHAARSDRLTRILALEPLTQCAPTASLETRVPFAHGEIRDRRLSLSAFRSDTGQNDATSQLPPATSSLECESVAFVVRSSSTVFLRLAHASSPPRSAPTSCFPLARKPQRPASPPWRRVRVRQARDLVVTHALPVVWALALRVRAAVTLHARVAGLAPPVLDHVGAGRALDKEAVVEVLVEGERVRVRVRALLERTARGLDPE